MSKLTWMSQADGSYVINVPERVEVQKAKRYWDFQHERLHITPNELGEFALSITAVQSERALGVFNTLQEALTTADEVLLRCRSDRIKLLQREASWHEYSASDASRK